MRRGAGGARWPKGTRGPRDRWGWHSGKGGSDRCRPAPSPTRLSPPSAFAPPLIPLPLSHFTSEVPHPSVPIPHTPPNPPAAYPVRRTLRRLPTDASPASLPHATPISTPLPIPPPICGGGWGPTGCRPGVARGMGGRGRPVPWMSHPLSRSGSPGSQPGEMAQRMEPRGRALEAGGREGEAAPPHALHTPTLLRPRGRRGGGWRNAKKGWYPPSRLAGAPWAHSASGDGAQGLAPAGPGTLPDALRSGQRPLGPAAPSPPGPFAPSRHPPGFRLLRIRSCHP